MVFNAGATPHQTAPVAPALAFHRSLPAYRVTPLVDLADVARPLRVGRLVVKDESDRLGLPSFKLLGSSWAIHERVRRHLERPEGAVLTLEELRARTRGVTLCTASDGNYGRSVAALAELLRCDAVIFLPAETAKQRIDDVRAHAASVEVVDAGYDQTVRRARAVSAERRFWYCPDTAQFDAAEDELVFARDVAAGYTTLFHELMTQLGRSPDVLFIQAGVGGLASGSVLGLPSATRIVIIEPSAANAVQASLAAGTPREVPDAFTIMAGLRAQSVSAAAWPLLRERVAAAMTIADDATADAMRLLAAHRVVAGEAGAAGVAGARIALAVDEVRARLGIGKASMIATVNTEGATDRAGYGRIVGG